MEIKDYEQCIVKACKESNIDLNEQMLKNFNEYYLLLSEWNEKFNLTAIKEKNDIYNILFADSIYGAKYIEKNLTLCDIGTGAGFPGLVLKIVRPDLDVLLVDALDKRVSFLNEIINKLELKNIKALHNRAEDKDFKDIYLNKFDVVTARAVAKMAALSEYCLPFVKIGGIFFAYKSDKIVEELKESKKAINILGGGEYKVINYSLDSETKRTFVLIKKQANTSSLYPRGQNKPKNKPIM